MNPYLYFYFNDKSDNQTLVFNYSVLYHKIQLPFLSFTMMQRFDSIIQEDLSENYEEQRQHNSYLGQLEHYTTPKISAETIRASWPSNYQYPSDYAKATINAIMVGHVDSGKSTLLGRLLLGAEQTQQYSNHKYGYPTERYHPQIKKETIGGDQAYISLPNRKLIIFEANRFRQTFIRNTIKIACKSEIGIVLISPDSSDIDQSELASSQTGQHIIMLKGFGVQKLIIIISKMDQIKWNQEHYLRVKSKVEKFLERSCPFEEHQFIPIDERTKKNLFENSEVESWYQGEFLTHILDTIKLCELNPDAPLRMPVTNCYQSSGGLYIEGKIISGKIHEKGQILRVFPNNNYVKVQEIMNEKQECLPFALCGENLFMRVQPLTNFRIQKGDVLCQKEDQCPVSNQFIAEFHYITNTEKNKLMSAGSRYLLHLNSTLVEVSISKLKNSKKGFMVPGDVAKIYIQSKIPIALEKYENLAWMGIFTLQTIHEGIVIGYGTILKYKASNSKDEN